MTRWRDEEQATLLFGRDRELSLIDRLIDGVKQRGQAVVIRGEAGIGKSALLAAARHGAAKQSFRTLFTSGVQSEARLAYSGLHLLLRPLLGRVDTLPVSQREALLSALGAGESVTPDLYLVALATLNLLAEFAAEAPLMIIVEDAQWLDGPTTDVLTFVGRRLESDPVVLLAAVRDGYTTPLDDARLPTIYLGRLDDTAAQALLEASHPHLLTRHRDLVLTHAKGNPLALLELPVAVAGAPRGPDAAPWVPLTRRLEEAFTHRISDLPNPTRTLLLVTSVNDGGDVAEIIRAAIAIDASVVGEEDFAPSISTGLVDLHRDEVLFRHPLVRSAIYQAASALQRRTAHGALAAAIEAEPDRRAWHLAASVTGLDEDIAGELDTAAERAQRRGGIAVAVAALERAAQLSVDSHRRAGRLLRAAELAYEQGRPDFVIQLMQEASQLELSPQDAARVLWLTGVSSSQGTDDGQMLVDLQEAAEAMRVANQADLALKLLTAAAQRCYYSEPPDEVRQSIVESLDRLDLEETDSRLLVALAFAAPIGRGAALMERLTRVRTAAQEGSQELTNLGTAAALLSDDDNTLRFLTSAVAAARRQGRLGLLPPILHSLAWAETHRGNWTLALPAAEEAIQIAREMSQELFAVGALVLQALQDAMRGNALSAEDRSREIERLGHLTGSAAILCVNQLARGVAALAKADYDAAYAQLVRVFDPSDAAFHFTRCWAIGDLAEAALHTGRADSVRGLLPSMDEIAQQSPLPWLQAGLSYAKALLANENEAESMFGAALAQDLTNRPFFRGRIQLEFGVWLRRRQRTAEARISLRAARDTLDTFGAVPWADRARNELRAAGEFSHVRSPSIGEQLTPQELQIAHLASKGLSNREIGQQLFLSHRTVGSHLYRIFPKLGITSRAQLASLLNSTSDPVHP